MRESRFEGHRSSEGSGPRPLPWDWMELDRREVAIDLPALFNALRLPVVDRRDANGAFWVVGGLELYPLMEYLRARGIEFHFKSEGGRATRRRPGWWTR
jgi:hypothetical protein